MHVTRRFLCQPGHVGGAGSSAWDRWRCVAEATRAASATLSHQLSAADSDSRYGLERSSIVCLVQCTCMYKCAGFRRSANKIPRQRSPGQQSSDRGRVESRRPPPADRVLTSFQRRSMVTITPASTMPSQQVQPQQQYQSDTPSQQSAEMSVVLCTAGCEWAVSARG